MASWWALIYAFACGKTVFAMPAQLSLRLRKSSGNHSSDKVIVPTVGEADKSAHPSLLDWEPIEASVPRLDDDVLSGPALLGKIVDSNTAEVALDLEDPGKRKSHIAMLHRTIPENIKAHWGSWIIGCLCFLLGFLILWFNELRSVKIDTLISRGVNECESIDASKATSETLGCLVHVQGHTDGMSPVVDPQFQGVRVNRCLKFQSTVEVYEWVQTVKIGGGQSVRRGTRDAQDRRANIRFDFHREWTTIHRNSSNFQSSAGRASPENPRPPRGLNFGTATTVCKDVHLGNFKLPEDMVAQLRNFQPAMPYLPKTVEACGLKFYADQDGYYYARPSARSIRETPSWKAEDAPSRKAAVGDIRVRFLCVLPGDATTVAVHCREAEVDTFCRFRAIPRACCSSTYEDRIRLIEEGLRSKQEIKDSGSDMAPCITTNRIIASCCCCPCSAINSVCSKEVVTEEIYYISEQHDDIEKPFEMVVPRNRWRAYLFRIIGWLICYLTAYMLAKTLSSEGVDIGESFYGRWAPAVLGAITATAFAALVIAAACLCYNPAQSIKWMCVVALVIAIPSMVAQVPLHGSA